MNFDSQALCNVFESAYHYHLLTSFHVIIGTDLSEEIAKVQRAMHKHFTVEKLTPIYDLDKFREFCSKAGAETLFDNTWRGMTSERHSDWC